MTDEANIAADAERERRRRRGIVLDGLIGAAAGTVATVPMTVVMELTRRRVPWWRREKLEPHQVTERVLRTFGADRRLDHRQRSAASTVAHFGFGAGAGALYGLLARRVPGRPVASGIGFGLAVCGASYLGWLPAVGLFHPLGRDLPPHRLARLAGAHVTWGAVLGSVVARFSARRTRP